VSVRPLPSSVGHPFGRGARKSSNSLLKSAIRKFSCRMIRLAMSCASSFAPSLARGREDDEDSSVCGLELRMAPMRRTTSGHEIVWMSSYEKLGDEWRYMHRWKAHIWYLKEVGIETVHVYESHDAQDKQGDLPNIESTKQEEE